MSAGTVLDVTQTSWRVAGAMPVRPGMHLTIQLWPSDGSGTKIDVAGATVLWVKGCEFALDVPSLSPHDRDWFTGFLTQKLSLSWMRPLPAAPAPFPKRTSGSAGHMTPDHEAAIQREILREIGMGTDYRVTIGRVRRECRRLIGGMQARHLRAQAGQMSIDDN